MIRVFNENHEEPIEIEAWPLAGGESNVTFLVEVAPEVGSSWEITNSCYSVYFTEISERLW
jgi:hypothetical protein